MRNRRFTLILAAITAAVLLLSAPASLREAWHRGGFYLFSRDFLEDIPRRLTGPGRFRFVLQPLMAIPLGIRSGRDDARTGQLPFLSAVLLHPLRRRDLLKSAFQVIVNVVLVGILMDSLFQWVLFGTSYPGAALVVGPVLIALPYAVARSLSNRIVRSRNGSAAP
jgi:hypothetical protein